MRARLIKKNNMYGVDVFIKNMWHPLTTIGNCSGYIGVGLIGSNELFDSENDAISFYEKYKNQDSEVDFVVLREI